MRDPTIPTHTTGGGYAHFPRIGMFVEQGDTVVLWDFRGQWWPADRVSYVMGGHGFDVDGASDLPRPGKIDSDGKVVVEGDHVVILFPYGNHKHPLVLGGVQAVRRADDDTQAFLPPRHAADETRNRKAWRWAGRDADGGALGKIDLELWKDDEPAVDLTVEKRITVKVGTDQVVTIELTDDGNLALTASKTTVSNGGTARKLATEDTVDKLLAMMDALKAGVLSAGPASQGTVSPTFDVDKALVPNTLTTTLDAE